MATLVVSHDDFLKELADTKRVLLLVMGNGPDFPKIVRSADKAILFPETQAALWIQDTSIFTQDELEDFQPGDPEFVACALSVPPRVVCARVSRPRALATPFMKGVEAAQNGTQPPLVLR